MGGNAGSIDPRTRYRIEGNYIYVYKKPGTLLDFLKKWKLSSTYNFDKKTKITKNQEKDNGSGTIWLQNGNSPKEGFYIYSEFSRFKGELENHGLDLSNNLY